MNNKLI